MSFTYIGQVAKEDNTFNVGEAFDIPAGTVSGDLLVMQVMSRGDYLFAAPSGWTTVSAVNNNNTTSGSPGRASNLVAYIVRGASTPSLVITGYSATIAARIFVKAYRPGAGETVSFIGSSLIDESTGLNTAHDHPSIPGLQPDDLLCMELASGNLTSCRYGAADAAIDPSTASSPPSGTTTDGAVVTTGLPAAGSWANRYIHRSSGAASYLVFSADGVASASGSSGTLTMASTASANMVGATMAFRAASGGPDTTPPTLTSPSGTGGLSVCSGSVSTDEGNGTLYAVATASTTQPSIAQIKAGQDHTGTAALRAVSQSVTATGTQTIASGAISGGAGTRYWHFVHTDAAANDSARVSSAGFSVTAPLAVTLDALIDEFGNPRAAYTVDKIWAVRVSDNTLVATWTSQTTNGSGVLPALSDAALTAVPHAFVTYNATGLKAGAKVYTPA